MILVLQLFRTYGADALPNAELVWQRLLVNVRPRQRKSCAKFSRETPAPTFHRLHPFVTQVCPQASASRAGCLERHSNIQRSTLNAGVHVWLFVGQRSAMSPTPIHVRWRHVAPDDRGGFHARKLSEHQLPKTQRRRIVARVAVGERHELSAGRERGGDRAHDAVLQRRHHVSPRETADDAARGLWRNVVAEMFG